MNKDEVTRLMRENHNVLTTEYGVSRIGIFGSVAKGTVTENSDLDIVVEFERPIGFKFIRLVEYLENLFGTKVDVITKDGLENIRVKEVARNIEKNLIYV
ncbi:MAG: nucleotidyltransferase family protein [bacterium]